jgi:hypothetical protein
MLLLDSIVNILPGFVRRWEIQQHTDGYLFLQYFPKSRWTFFKVSWGGVGLGPLGTSVTNCPTVPAPDDRWWWVWSSRWNEKWQRTPKYSEKTCPNATLSTTNPIWSDLGWNPGRRGGKPTNNRLSYGTVLDGPVSLYTCEEYFSRWCDALYIGRSLPTFRRNVMPPLLANWYVGKAIDTYSR